MLDTPETLLGMIVLLFDFAEMFDVFLVNGFCLLSTPDLPGIPAAS